MGELFSEDAVPFVLNSPRFKTEAEVFTFLSGQGDKTLSELRDRAGEM